VSIRGLCAGPIFQSRPSVAGVVRPHGSSIGSSRGGTVPILDRPRRLRPAAPGICPVTARTLQEMAPYPGQARCLAPGLWPECFRRLDFKGGRRSFPQETLSALDIEGKHVTIQGPSLDPRRAITLHLAPGERSPLGEQGFCGYQLRAPRAPLMVFKEPRGRPPR